MLVCLKCCIEHCPKRGDCWLAKYGLRSYGTCEKCGGKMAACVDCAIEVRDIKIHHTPLTKEEIRKRYFELCQALEEEREYHKMLEESAAKYIEKLEEENKRLGGAVELAKEEIGILRAEVKHLEKRIQELEAQIEVLRAGGWWGK